MGSGGRADLNEPQQMTPAILTVVLLCGWDLSHPQIFFYHIVKLTGQPCSPRQCDLLPHSENKWQMRWHSAAQDTPSYDEQQNHSYDTWRGTKKREEGEREWEVCCMWSVSKCTLILQHYVVMGTNSSALYHYFNCGPLTWVCPEAWMSHWVQPTAEAATSSNHCHYQAHQCHSEWCSWSETG